MSSPADVEPVILEPTPFIRMATRLGLGACVVTVGFGVVCLAVSVLAPGSLSGKVFVALAGLGAVILGVYGFKDVRRSLFRTICSSAGITGVIFLLLLGCRCGATLGVNGVLST